MGRGVSEQPLPVGLREIVIGGELRVRRPAFEK
jgi:hypothetical protein